MNKLKKLGISKEINTEANQYPELFVGRISSQTKNIYKVMTDDKEFTAEVSGKFRYNIDKISDYPAVGDFVMVDKLSDDEGHAIIHHVLSRKTAIIRKAAGTSNDEQLVATNVDIVYICMSLNNDFNIRRIERYLSIVWDSGAMPVIVLTKSDLCDNLTEKLIELDEVAIGVEVIVTSTFDPQSLEYLENQLLAGTTAAFIGSSGVGKSTIINYFLGKTILETDGLRNDDKGRHTTTYRELFISQKGGTVIDTPGMREIGFESADITRTFNDIDILAQQCKFNDCSHTNEPKCAVLNAIAEGNMSLERYDSYLKLRREAKYAGLSSKEIERTKLNEIFRDYGGMKNARKMQKQKNNL
ncbi:ribosome small subunit-dependent GTPase A [Ruoffia tabacinasalis]|uniref:Small ribosomal subunit biogenesis GTPase RsgA n=1 Tax=Ruoffia tabacinasalis TaxID=87458 RepID=A0A5R9EH12_9LACT|nr:ribosome small subunit-dependent GTPase A [Ruoffia tabacinasalis]TLQ49522.1 ribosome small subunit-dependent GTPase A [Ruoffia tabacinasalis]